MNYEEFLANKRQSVDASGFDVTESDINPAMFKFQNAITRWALALGKAAIFAECGLGKTLMQLEWARHVAQHTDGKVLILAPLAVAGQTVREGVKFNIEVKHVYEQADVDNGRVFITNYERLDKFDASAFTGIVLDESSILKNFTGKTKRAIVDSFKDTPYKLACTATPAPNDHLELGNHAEFLDIMPSNEMIARWFINDHMKAGAYRLKNHARKDFWRWLTSWAVCISQPSDLGEVYTENGFNLPELKIIESTVDVAQETIERAWSEGKLLPDANASSTGIHKVKRESLPNRIEETKRIMSEIPDNEPVILWCDTNDEADALNEAFPNAVEVRGSHSADVKEERLLGFSNGDYRIIITKPSIAGFGMNWQHCHYQIFVGISFSFENLYQAIKRSHRFGQRGVVYTHLIYSDTEGNVMQALQTKEDAFKTMQSEMNEAMREYGLFRQDQRRVLIKVDEDVKRGKDWTMYLGDCVPTTAKMKDDSIHFSVYSPPFANLYIYSDSEADMGNASDMDEFLKHYRYLIRDIYRVTMPGRLTAVHVKDLPLYKNSSEWFGIEDFSGLVAMLHRQEGWIFHSRITIWKSPVTEMEKTNSHGLLHKNFAQRTQVCRVGLPDYLMVFVKPDPDSMGEDVKQLRKPGDYIGTQPPQEYEYLNSLRQRTPAWYPNSVEDYNYSISVWQRYASPVWFDIDQTNVLNFQIAKGDQDEKHICPLQLDVIGRSIDLWTNKGDVVYSPFAGIGSEGYEALKLGRKFVGVELKPEYWNWAVKNLTEAERQANQVDLFQWAEMQSEASAD